MRRALLFFVFLCIVSYSFAADKDYEPYSEDEFPLWAHRVRRFEIISLGIFPFSLFFTQFGYSFYRYASSGFDYTYAPAPFGPPGGSSFSDTEHMWIIVGAASLSLVAAFVDNMIVYSSDNNAYQSPSDVSFYSPRDYYVNDNESVFFQPRDLTLSFTDSGSIFASVSE